jgi:hypothetical protein
MLTVQCPHCGSFNDDSAAICYLCKKELPVTPDREAKVKEAKLQTERSARSMAGKERRSSEYERPGCVSIYAILTFLSGGFGIVFALFLPTLLAENSNLLLDPANFPSGVNPVDPEFLSFMRTYFMGYSIFLFLSSVLSFLVGWGLWTMRNWARIFILVTQGISFVIGVVGLFASIVTSNGNLFVCGSYLFSLIFPGIILFWFLMNRRLFR